MKIQALIGGTGYLSCYKCGMEMDFRLEDEIMAMEVLNNVYGSYAAEAAGISTVKNIKDMGTGQTAQTAQKPQRGKHENMADYVSRLTKLAPSVEFRVGSTFPSAKSGKTLTINPGILKKMQNDPEQEKETKELIKGVEFMTKMMDGIYKASGRRVVFRHSYIDENGKYSSFAYIKKEDKLSPKLRKERRKNSVNLIKRIKEKTAKRKEELSEGKKAVKAEEKPAYGRAKEFLDEKLAASKDGMIHLDNTDFKKLIEAAKGIGAGKTDAEGQTHVGGNLDLQV